MKTLKEALPLGETGFNIGDGLGIFTRHDHQEQINFEIYSTLGIRYSATIKFYNGIHAYVDSLVITHSNQGMSSSIDALLMLRSNEEGVLEIDCDESISDLIDPYRTYDQVCKMATMFTYNLKHLGILERGYIILKFKAINDFYEKDNPSGRKK
ncbi:hypothetical protein CL619_02215 [archaeon]|nr:hypothetical protein [archaeon]|tara:strand:+ start:286 stop:747 length:462 start_codon:yes stop_codon:yes gene_type:complete